MAMGKPRAVLVAFALLVVLDRGLVRANFYDECDVTWGPQNTAIWGNGENLALSLDSDHIGKKYCNCHNNCLRMTEVLKQSFIRNHPSRS